jgi:hypothetical protein
MHYQMRDTIAMGTTCCPEGCTWIWGRGAVTFSNATALVRDYQSALLAAPESDLRGNDGGKRKTPIMPILSLERHMRWLRDFEPLMVITVMVTPLATLPSISKLYFTHSQHASGQSLTTWSVLALASLLAAVRIAQSKPRYLCWKHPHARNELADGEWHPDARRMDLLSYRASRWGPQVSSRRMVMCRNQFEKGSALRKKVFRLVFAAMLGACPPRALRAQELVPRAYVITPVQANAVILTYSFYTGGLLFNNVLPITNATSTIDVSAFSYYHSLSFFGRSANLTASLPYGLGNSHGTFIDNETKLYRSGLLDSSFRFSVNLIGGPAMHTKEFQSWRQKTLLGISLKVVAPTGQYDGTKLINNGTNRWAFKPELGYSRRVGHWVMDAYGGVWFFTRNPEFFSHNAFVPGTLSQSQKPIVVLEGHLSYDVKPRFWVSLDGNAWFGGSTGLNGVEDPLTFQTSSLIGVSASIPLSKHQSLKAAYDYSDFVRYGGKYQNVSVAWQYFWIGWPKL